MRPVRSMGLNYMRNMKTKIKATNKELAKRKAARKKMINEHLDDLGLTELAKPKKAELTPFKAPEGKNTLNEFRWVTYDDSEDYFGYGVMLAWVTNADFGGSGGKIEIYDQVTQGPKVYRDTLEDLARKGREASKKPVLVIKKSEKTKILGERVPETAKKARAKHK